MQVMWTVCTMWFSTGTAMAGNGSIFLEVKGSSVLPLAQDLGISRT